VDVRVARVSVEVGLPLRQRVLRPHETIEQLRANSDDEPATGNFAAFADGEVVCTASVRREAPPWDAGVGPAWRLRGMATDERWRGRGIGAQVLDAVLGHVGSHGGGLLWCNARVPALSFYRRAGFRTRGDAWDDPLIGPHIAMERTVAASPAAEP
jgi:GNAT superfamily N-acetyltransferase